MLLSVRDLTTDLGGFALRDIAFDVKEGEYFVLLGESGVGKTVLLESIVGIVRPDSGRVFLADKEITDERIQARNLALVYQDQALFPHMTVAHNIDFGLRCRKLSRSQIRDRVRELAEDVEITGLLERRPGTLSGGEAQRVALARALATEPRCLLLDEPISALDVTSRAGLQGLLRRLNRQGLTTIHVTHDYEEAVSLASRVAIMEAGRIVQVGPPEEVFRHPKSEFVAKFVGIRNFLRGKLQRIAGSGGELAEFATPGPALVLLTNADSGPGFFTIRSEDITLSPSRPETSARNVFHGVIVDIVPARRGVEIVVDIGLEISALITEGSVGRLGLECGGRIWVSFKATAGRFLAG